MTTLSSILGAGFAAAIGATGSAGTNGTNGATGVANVNSVFTITDAAAFEINPANGGIQTITLGASRTPKGTNGNGNGNLIMYAAFAENPFKNALAR